MTAAKHKSDFKLKQTLHISLASNGQIGEYAMAKLVKIFLENWPRHNDAALYCFHTII